MAGSGRKRRRRRIPVPSFPSLPKTPPTQNTDVISQIDNQQKPPGFPAGVDESNRTLRCRTDGSSAKVSEPEKKAETNIPPDKNAHQHNLPHNELSVNTNAPVDSSSLRHDRPILQSAHDLKRRAVQRELSDAIGGQRRGMDLHRHRFSLQQKKEEYFTFRELQIMNSATPPRVGENLTRGASPQRPKQPTPAPMGEAIPWKTSNESVVNQQVTPPVLSPPTPPVLSPPLLSHDCEAEGVTLLKSPGTSSECDGDTSPFRLFFVEKGRDMHSGVLGGPKDAARRRGGEILSVFDPSDPPTHLIISNDQAVSLESIASELNFGDVQELRDYVQKHRIVCATKTWAAMKSTKSLYEAPPTLMNNQLYRPLFFGRHRGPTKKRKRHEAVATLVPAPAGPPKRNLNVSRLLQKLSKIYREAPLEPMDLWRAYTFQMISGRVRHLHYDLALDNLKELKEIKGVGASSLAVVKEYLEHAEALKDHDDSQDPSGDPLYAVDRLRNAENDPQRVALRQMMQIWGIGHAKGMDLVRAGFRTVAEVRKAFDECTLCIPLLRNQCIGLVNHDELLERMDKYEVESIAKIIKNAVHARYANADVETLGSYRRRKGTYGDVDILITHPKYVTVVPPKALGKIVQDLRRKGHITYHLTCHDGMDADEFDKSLPDEILSRMAVAANPKKPGSRASAADSSSMCSYMGVFVSPKTGKMRRVDIKFYPYRERAFASLHFIGSGYFNRSMRLWATRKFGWKLSDHGLFDRETDVRIMDAVKTEEEIFAKLGLMWKEPHERDCFDAVVGISKGQQQCATKLDGFTDREFRQESQYKWIE